MVTARPQPKVMLVKPPCTIPPGFADGNNTTMATTPMPKSIRTKVPRNSAINSAIREGFGLIPRLPVRLHFASGPRSSLTGVRAGSSSGFAHSLSTVLGGANVDLRTDSRGLAIALRDLRRKIGRVLLPDEIDRASSEATAGHTPATEAGQAFGSLDHDVEFPATDLVQVAQAGVRLTHQLAHASQVTIGQRLGSLNRSLVFVDHVGTSFQDYRRKIGGVPVEQFDGDVAQSAHSGVPGYEIANRLFALFAASIVGAVGQFVFDSRIANHKPNVLGNGNELELQRTAIQKNCAPRLPHTGDELVHDTDSRPNEIVLGLTAQFRNLRQGQAGSAEVHQGERGSYLDRGRRTQPGSDRDLRVDEKICADKFVPVLLKNFGNAHDVVAPCTGALPRHAVEIEFEVAGEFFGVDGQLSIPPWGDGHIGREADRGGHDEPVAVVGMLTNQVDSAGRTIDSRATAVNFLKVVSQLPNLHARWSFEPVCDGQAHNKSLLSLNLSISEIPPPRFDSNRVLESYPKSRTKRGQRSANHSASIANVSASTTVPRAMSSGEAYSSGRWL